MTRILVTNDGPHSAEKWAVATAETICDIDPALRGERVLAAQKLQLDIAAALMPHHEGVQKSEQGKLKAKAEHVMSEYKADEFMNKAVADIQKAAQGTPWATHFQDVEVVAAIKTILAKHFMASQHVERLWHADHNPDNEHVKAFKAKFQV